MLSYRHGRKSLDLTLTVRYAGLPNLAKLELIKTEQSRSETNVLIGSFGIWSASVSNNCIVIKCQTVQDVIDVYGIHCHFKHGVEMNSHDIDLLLLVNLGFRKHTHISPLIFRMCVFEQCPVDWIHFHMPDIESHNLYVLFSHDQIYCRHSRIRVKKSPAKKFPAIKSPKVTWCAIKFPAKNSPNLSMSLLLFRNKGILRYLLAYK